LRFLFENVHEYTQKELAVIAPVFKKNSWRCNPRIVMSTHQSQSVLMQKVDERRLARAAK